MRSECKGYGELGKKCTAVFEAEDRDGLISQEIEHYLDPANIAVSSHGRVSTVHMHREFLEDDTVKRVYDHGETGTFTTTQLDDGKFIPISEDPILAYKLVPPQSEV